MRRAGIILGILTTCALPLPGCTPGPGDDGPPVDGPDAGASPDASEAPAGAGLSFRFESEPRLSGDGEIGGEYDAVIREVELILTDVRAIGDAAPGDERTSRERLELSWAGGEVEELGFPQAPPGIYSQLLGEIDAYEITGTLEIDDRERSFRIAEQGAGLMVSLGLDGLALEPGMDRRVDIEVDLRKAVRAVDWSQVPEDGQGWLHVDQASDMIDEVRAELEDGFERDSSGSDGEDD